jgi:hypothetical protein
MLKKVILVCVLFVAVYQSLQNGRATQENPEVCRKFTVLKFRKRAVFEEFHYGL